jgi:hypothetical protein
MSDTNQTNTEIPTAPMLLRVGVLIASAAAGLSALPWIWFAIGRFGGFDWGLFGFEVMTLVAGVFGVLLGMGRFREGWAIGVTAIAGSMLVSLVFGLFVGFIFSKRVESFPELATLTDVTLYLRVVVIGVLGAAASLAVFARSSRSWGYVVRSAAVGGPLVVAAGLIYKDMGPGAWVNSLLGSSGPVAGVTLLSVGLVGIVLFSIAAHLLIRAYECGRYEQIESAQSEAIRTSNSLTTYTGIPLDIPILLAGFMLPGFALGYFFNWIGVYISIGIFALYTLATAGLALSGASERSQFNASKMWSFSVLLLCGAFLAQLI